MASLKYEGNVNRMTVTLASGYTAASGSMSLTAGHGARLPSSGDFWIVTTSGTYRAFKVTARSTDTLTVTAAQDGTSDGNLDAGTELKWSLTKSALDQLRADLILSDTYANLPAAGQAGRLFLPTDSPYELRDNGASWDHFLPWHGKVTPPDLADFSWLNQGAATSDVTRGGIIINGDTTDTEIHGLIRDTNLSSPYTVDVIWATLYSSDAGSGGGLILQQSSDGHLIFYAIRYFSSSAVGQFNAGHWHSPSSFSADRSSTSTPSWRPR